MRKSTILVLIIAVFAIQGKSKKSTDLDDRTNGSVTIYGVTYKTVRIGNQEWMAENLKMNVGSGCWCYENAPDNCNQDGMLYTWEAAKRAASKVAGWHLPSDAEWTQLENYLGKSFAGKKLKSTSGWDDYEGASGNGTNSTGFNALSGGYRATNGNFLFKGSDAYFWTATASSSSDAWKRSLNYGGSGVGRYYRSKGYGYAVRLARD